MDNPTIPRNQHTYGSMAIGHLSRIRGHSTHSCRNWPLHWNCATRTRGEQWKLDKISQSPSAVICEAKKSKFTQCISGFCLGSEYFYAVSKHYCILLHPASSVALGKSATLKATSVYLIYLCIKNSIPWYSMDNWGCWVAQEHSE